MIQSLTVQSWFTWNVTLMLMLSTWSVCLELEWVWTWYHMWLSLLQECRVCSSRQVANIRTVDQWDDTNTDSYIVSQKWDLNKQLTITLQTLVTTEACVHQGFEPGTYDLLTNTRLLLLVIITEWPITMGTTFNRYQRIACSSVPDKMV